MVCEYCETRSPGFKQSSVYLTELVVLTVVRNLPMCTVVPEPLMCIEDKAQ